MSASGETPPPRFAIAAIDLDDTLVGRDGMISPANVAAVARLVAMGVRVLLASGRSHANMLPFHRQLGLPAGPIISAQGAIAQDSHSGEVWFEIAIPTAEVAEVTRDGHAHGFAVQQYRPTGIHADTRNSWTDYDQGRNAEPHRYVDDLLTSGEGGAVPDDVAKIIWLGDPDAIDAATAPAHARYEPRLVVTRTDPPYLEFSAPNVTKATALAAVARTLEVTQAETLAFGDGNNDAAMLAWAGLGVAMPHASPAALAAADRVGPDGDPETALARAVAMVLDDAETRR
ncbi:MAG TPA: Cof-type HAD-IIB family hydrolase [Gemmatimonadaceae bacterium]